MAKMLRTINKAKRIVKGMVKIKDCIIILMAMVMPVNRINDNSIRAVDISKRVFIGCVFIY